jgi:hypothetical protein
MTALVFLITSALGQTIRDKLILSFFIPEDELAREYRETHDPEIREEIYRLARQLKELDH